MEEDRMLMDNFDGIVLCLEVFAEENAEGGEEEEEEEDFKGKSRTESGAEILVVFWFFSNLSFFGASVEGVFISADLIGVKNSFEVCNEEDVADASCEEENSGGETKGGGIMLGREVISSNTGGVILSSNTGGVKEMADGVKGGGG